jgi:alkyl hydroperoxide reductase subunit AhpC
MTAKPISLISTDGNNKSLSESIAAGKCTLLLFWSSECSHCREEMPSIKSLYQRYHSRGLEIYAVSLEQDKDKWLSYITKHNLLWTNVRNDFSLPINPAMEYVVLSTPAMILIDSKGKVVHRFVPKSKVEKYVSALLD